MADERKHSTEKQGRTLHRLLYRVYRRYAGVSRFWRQRLTTSGWFVIIAVATSAAVGVDTNQNTAYQLFTLLGAIGLFSMLYNSFFRPRLKLTRSCPRFASAGTPFRYRVTIDNRGRSRHHSLNMRELLDVPHPDIESFLKANEPGETERNKFDRTFLFYRWLWLVDQKCIAEPNIGPRFSLPAKGKQTISMELTPLKRGILQLDECHILRTDPFGLLQAPHKLKPDTPSTVTVLPKRYALPPLSLAGKSQYQPCGVALASSIGQSEEFMGLREYRPGDPIRHFHWKSWAKTGKPIVMEFEDEFFPRYALALDTFAQDDHDNVFEAAVSVAASFACTLDTKESLLDLMFVGSEAYCFTSGRGTSQPEHLLEILASVELSREKQFKDLENLVRVHARQLSACVCIFIDWDDARRDCVNSLRAIGTEVMVIVLCAEKDLERLSKDNPSIHFISAARTEEGLLQL